MNNATMVAIVHNLADGLNYKAAAVSAGSSARNFWRAIKNSQEGKPGYMVSYLDEDLTFADACATARRVHSMQVRSSYEQYCLTGRDEVVTYNGEVQYQKDPALIGKPWLIDMLGLDDDYIRNSKGEVQPLTVVRKPSDAAVLRFLEASHGDEYRPSSVQNIITTNLNKAPTRPVVRYSEEAPPIPPPRPPIPELLVLPDLPEQAEQDPEPDADAPEPSEPARDTLVADPTKLERIIREAPPAAEYTPPPQTDILAPPRDAPPAPAPSNINAKLRAGGKA